MRWFLDPPEGFEQAQIDYVGQKSLLALKFTLTVLALETVTIVVARKTGFFSVLSFVENVRAFPSAYFIWLTSTVSILFSRGYISFEGIYYERNVLCFLIFFHMYGQTCMSQSLCEFTERATTLNSLRLVTETEFCKRCAVIATLPLRSCPKPPGSVHCVDCGRCVVGPSIGHWRFVGRCVNLSRKSSLVQGLFCYLLWLAIHLYLCLSMVSFHATIDMSEWDAFLTVNLVSNPILFLLTSFKLLDVYYLEAGKLDESKLKR